MADEEEVIPGRFKRKLERQEALKAYAPQRVRVNPRDDEMRKILKHPAYGGFLSEGSVEWPLDQFTKRRLSDGSIVRAVAEAVQTVSPEAPPPQAEPEKAEPEPEKRAAAARRPTT
jgi:hypothetical protein